MLLLWHIELSIENGMKAIHAMFYLILTELFLVAYSEYDRWKTTLGQWQQKTGKVVKCLKTAVWKIEQVNR